MSWCAVCGGVAKRWATVRQFNWGNSVITQLNHINIIRYFDSGKSNGLPYVVLNMWMVRTCGI